MEYKSAEEYIKSDKFKEFHKNRKIQKKENAAKHKALEKVKENKFEKNWKSKTQGEKEGFLKEAHKREPRNNIQ